MRNTAPFRLAALAVLALGAAQVAGPAAQAKITSNGTSFNGASLNGVGLNGISVNGVSPNGMSFQGTSLNGLSPNGIQMQGANLNGVSPNGAADRGPDAERYAAPSADPDRLPLRAVRPRGE